MWIDVIVPYLVSLSLSSDDRLTNTGHDNDVLAKRFSHSASHHAVQLENLIRCTRDLSVDVMTEMVSMNAAKS